MAAVEAAAAFKSQDHFSFGYPSVNLTVMETRLPHAGGAVVSSQGSAVLRTTPPVYPAMRPPSACTVQITEYKEARVNPEPIPIEETDFLLDEHLSTRKLRDLTGEDNLELVKFLEIKVNTQETSMGNFGAHLPNMTQLKLSNSVITSVRDLGSSLDNLSVLWMARCSLEDIDGVASMTNLKELYLAYNEVYDLSPCSMLENLTILDVEGNNIANISQIECIALCYNLTNLTLEGNPVCLTPSPDEVSVDYDYRNAIKLRMPELQYLDDEPLTGGTSSQPRRPRAGFDDDWRLIEELMEDGTLAGVIDEPVSGIERPVTSMRQVTAFRPRSALKQQRPGTSSWLRPVTSRDPGSGGRPGTTARPLSGRLGSATGRPSSRGGGMAEETEIAVEDTSDLTKGAVICGNPSKAFKSRRRNLTTEPQNDKLTKLLDQHAKNPHSKPSDEPSAKLPAEDNGSDISELLAELKNWKTAHQELQKELDLQHIPQVLRINHDDEVALSGDESVDSDLEDSDASPGQRLYSGTPSGPAPRPQSSSRMNHSRRHQLSAQPIYDEATDRSVTPSFRKKGIQYDDSFEARDDMSASPGSPELRLSGTGASSIQSNQAAALDETRTSGQIAPRGSKIRLGPVIDKGLMRATLTSPNHRSPESPVPIKHRSDGLSLSQLRESIRARSGGSTGSPQFSGTAGSKSGGGSGRSRSGGSAGSRQGGSSGSRPGGSAGSLSGSSAGSQPGSSAGSPTGSPGGRGAPRGHITLVPLLPAKLPGKFM